MFREQPFARNILNSVFVAVSTVVLSLALAVAAVLRPGPDPVPGPLLLLFTILGVSMFPQIAVLSGMFELVRWLGIYNNLLGADPLLHDLHPAVHGLGADHLHARAAQGARGGGDRRRRQALGHRHQGVHAAAGPALATTGLLAFIAAWNEFLFALTFTLSTEMRTVPVAIALISGASAYELPWGNIMAASVIVTVPLLVLVLVFQRRIVSGLTAGAVKG